MEIERINENTVKFFISYVDVEERGFDREEIWYNREKSEELFWEMMDEVHQEEDFTFDGPLWIQVQALDKGLEVVVTKAQLSKDGNPRFDIIADEKAQTEDRIGELLDHHFHFNNDDQTEVEEEDYVSFIAYFHDFEDVINLAKRPWPKEMETKLFSYDNKYYLYVEFSYDFFTETEIDNNISLILEYGIESERTIEFLQEYGKEVISTDVFTTINHYFL
ncbi:adaptor protein MecA [Bacillus kwashiorkori]|uniref:adaptor protein MecA n=1 Tax=Bacillus kwashiorkori TaxID=1522318 RepID=UPI00078458CC|nr:adaptor protein MecA [Bacillus kwashiorkori]